VLVVAVIFLTRSSGPAATPSSSPSASASASPSDGTASPEVSASPSASAPASPSASADASASPSGADAPASFTVVDLKLDATDDPDGQARVITFTSDAPGTITVSLTSKTPQGTTHMCLSQGSKEVGCEDWAKGTFTRTTNQSNVKWTVTVIGDGIETPVVSVKATFPSSSPAMQIQQARFDGTDFPEYNGVSVAFQARTAGSVGVVATWGEQPLNTEIAIANDASGTVDVSGSGETSDGINASIPIEAGGYRLSLTNTEGGPGSLELAFELRWP
jgi:hypothetical protein